VTVDSAGNIPFAAYGSGSPYQGAIGKVAADTVSTPTFKEFVTPTAAGANPTYLTTDHDGNVWFTEPGISKVAELDPGETSANTSAGITEYPLSGTRAGYITTASDGDIWASQGSRLIKIVPPVSAGGAVTMTTYQTPDAGAVEGLAAASRGTSGGLRSRS
jgi:streptogramin lyase